MAEADRETDQGASEEYSRPLSPLTDIITPKVYYLMLKTKQK